MRQIFHKGKPLYKRSYVLLFLLAICCYGAWYLRLWSRLSHATLYYISLGVHYGHTWSDSVHANKWLTQERVVLRRKQSMLQARVIELERLLHLKHFERSQDLGVLAHVIAKVPVMHPLFLMLDIGAQEGVMTGELAVNTHGYVVGRVVQLEGNHALLMLLRHPKMYVPVSVGQKDVWMARGDGVHMILDLDRKLISGAMTYTTSDDFLIPKGLKMGVLHYDEVLRKHEILTQPYSEEVIVVTHAAAHHYAQMQRLWEDAHARLQ